MYLAIDPGRQKFGWVLADEDGGLKASGIVPTESLNYFVEALASRELDALQNWLIEGELSQDFFVEKIFCGDGTGHGLFLKTLAPLNADVSLVKETNTTLDARAVYWKINPPRGLRRLVPLSLQVPPRNIDDLAAYCILRRALCLPSA